MTPRHTILCVQIIWITSHLSSSIRTDGGQHITGLVNFPKSGLFQCILNDKFLSFQHFAIYCKWFSFPSAIVINPFRTNSRFSVMNTHFQTFFPDIILCSGSLTPVEIIGTNSLWWNTSVAII